MSRWKRRKEMDYREYKDEYRFQLDRRPGRARLKMDCPQCGKRRCLTPYVDVVTGEPVGPEFGRCDHERTCGYNRYPSGKDLGDRPIWVSSNEVKKSFLKPKEGEVANFITYQELLPYNSNLGENTLYRFLSHLFDPYLVESVFRRYMVGTMDLWSWKGCAVFWQIDKDFVCRTGKVMHYEVREQDGKWVDVKRVKEGEDETPHVMYYHALKGRDYLLRQCLFGEHLLNAFPEDKTVNVVEAEKTALICAINKPDELFLATGGLQNLRAETMQVLKGRRVVLFPDKGDASKVWKEKVDKNLPYYNIKISDSINHLDLIGDGDDLADYIIKKKLANA